MSLALDEGSENTVREKLMALALDEEALDDEAGSRENSPEAGYATAPGSPQKVIQAEETERLMQILLAAINGTIGPMTFSHIVKIGHKQVVALVDSGSTNTFMDYEFALKNNLKLAYQTARKVEVVGGGELVTDAIISGMHYSVGNTNFNNSFKLLKLKSYDIILGGDWIYEHSPIGLDLQKRLLTVTKNGNMLVFPDHTAPGRKCMISAKKLEERLRKGVMGCVIHVELIQDAVIEEVTPSPKEVEEILHQYTELFEEPKELPPPWSCDHAIPLKSGAEPPNLRPYKVPHYQRTAMEEMIKQMLKSGDKTQFQPIFLPNCYGEKEGWLVEVVCGLQTAELVYYQKQVPNACRRWHTQ
uniref:Uncharacterized protein n=1 Tax=Arundo donax TaxID=35708 RepID=A0A0A8XUB0_ARUDO